MCSVLCESMQSLGRPGEFAGWWLPALDCARMPVQRAGICGRAQFARDIHLATVPGQAARAVGRFIGGQVALARPQSARTGNQLQSQRLCGLARAVDGEVHVVTDGDFEAGRAQVAADGQHGEVGIRPASSEQVAMDAEFHRWMGAF